MLMMHKGVEKMRENFDSKDENGDLNKRRSYKPMDESLFETIQFTEEELRKIRQPNRQPLDGDYFEASSRTDSQNTEDKTDSVTKDIDESRTSETDSEEAEPNSLEFVEVKGPPAPTHKEIISAPEDSEFHYKSPVKARLEQKIEEEKAKEEIEYWDEYEKSEMEFWNHTGETEIVEESSKTPHDVKRKKQGFRRKIASKQASSEQTEANEKFIQKANAIQKKDGILKDADQGKKIVDKVKSMINGKDAVDFEKYMSESERAVAEASDRTKKKPQLSEKNEGNLFNRAKTALDSHLSRSVTKELVSETELKEEPQSDKVSNITLPEEEAFGERFQESDSKETDIALDETDSFVEIETGELPHPNDGGNEEAYELGSTDTSKDLSQEELPPETLKQTSHSQKVTDEDADLFSEKISQKTRRFSEPILTDQVLEEVLGADDITIEDELDHQSESFVKGAAWLTIGSVFSRILGALYIIPWSTWLGAEYTQANTLYSAGYTPYSLFLAIATAGFPSAIAKQMAFYHSKKEYRVADKLFKNSIVLMLLSGLISGSLLYLLAPSLAAITSTDNPVGATMVIRSLVPALLILPLMSILRGYFQGFNDMVPSAISQIIEQIARVFYLLAATYAIMMVYRGEVTQAVVHSTFAAFVGALAALIYLAILYFKRLPMINKLKERSLDLIEIDFKESIRIMFMDSVPFILLGSGIILAQVIDTYTFKQILLPTTVMLLREISELYGAMSLDVNKLVMIVVSLAVALASSVVPLITSKFAARDIKGTSSLIEQIVEVFSFVMLPAAIGMIGVSNNLYTMFYPQGHASGPALLITGSVMSISLGLYTVLSTVLQSMNFRRLAVRFLVVGLLVKLILQVPMVAFLHAHGAMIATTIAFAVSSVLMWIKIQREVEPNLDRLFKSVSKIIIGTIIMGITVSQWNSLLDLLMGDVGRFLTFVKVMLGVGIGIFVYGGTMGLLGQLSILLGDKKQDLQEKMRMF